MSLGGQAGAANAFAHMKYEIENRLKREGLSEETKRELEELRKFCEEQKASADSGWY